MAGAFRDVFFFALALEAAERVVFFVVFRRVWPSDETAMSDARTSTAMNRSFLYSILLIGYEVST
jgi:hypothetical protein